MKFDEMSSESSFLFNISVMYFALFATAPFAGLCASDTLNYSTSTCLAVIALSRGADRLGFRYVTLPTERYFGHGFDF